MASVTLTDAWFHLADDPAQFVVMVLTGESDMTRRPTEVRRYAGGRVRAVTRRGRTKRLNLNFELAERADLEQLEEWIGEVVMFRDPLGRLVFGVYGAVEGGEIPGTDGTVLKVNLTLDEVTYSIEAA